MVSDLYIKDSSLMSNSLIKLFIGDDNVGGLAIVLFF